MARYVWVSKWQLLLDRRLQGICEFLGDSYCLTEDDRQGMCEFLSDSYCLTEDEKVCMNLLVSVIV